MKIALTVNGRAIAKDVSPRTHLADFVREDLLLTGTHIGCEHGVCGACTVVINGETARSCITYAAQCDGAEVRTIEGFADDTLMVRLRHAFTTEHALQCGYCTPGMLIAARDLIRRKGGLAEAQIRTEMSGNLCRCTGYVGIIRAIQSVMAERDGLLADVEPKAKHLGALPETVAGATVARPETSRALRSTEGAPPSSPKFEIAPFDETRATKITESVRIAAARSRVWDVLGDIDRMAACLPGVALYDRTGGYAKGDAEPIAGLMRIKLGPVTATFAGQALLTRSPADWSGALDGQGAAKDSGSRVRGRMTYRLAEDGPDATQIHVAIAYSLTGPLAQFGRGDLVRDLLRQIARTFAANIEAHIKGGTAAPVRPAEIKAASLLWSVLVTRIKRMLGLGR